MQTVTEYQQTDLGGWVRRGEGYDGMGRRYWIRVTDSEDVSPVHTSYPTGYDERCGWCWLGAAHSDQEHGARVARAA
jgi:hypothetical protein